MVEILFLVVFAFDLLGGAETLARIVAALFLVLHPIHEQALGFRVSFNRAVHDPPCVEPGRARWSWPLGPRMNALQAIFLATAFPALALFGPWWAVAGVFAFYVGDALWTHREKKVPGGWSAWLAGAAAAVLYVCLHEAPITARGGVVAALSMAAGFALLALPWWMAYRSVRRG